MGLFNGLYAYFCFEVKAHILREIKFL